MIGVGLLSFSGYLALPPGVNFDTVAATLKTKEVVLVQKNPSLPSLSQSAEQAFKDVEGVPLSDSSINYVVKTMKTLDTKCLGCNVTTEDVRNSTKLKHDVGYIYFLDLVQKHGIEKAKVLYRNQS